MKTDSKSLKMMGTTIDLKVSHPEADQILEELHQLLIKYNKRFSANDHTSELSAINLNAGITPVKVHPELFELIDLGKKHSLANDSYLNIAIGPLIKLWSVGFSDARKPSQIEIDKTLKLLDVRNISLNHSTLEVFLSKKGMEIDLGALAKGYIADRLADHLRNRQVASALVNLGGNLITIGPALNRPDHYWRIGIQNPMKIRGETTLSMRSFNQSFVTSGIYERTLIVDGETYHHIFDDKTGYPIKSSLASLTIISEKSVDGEIWTTRLFGHSPPKIIELINLQQGIEGIVIGKNGDYLYSDGINQNHLIFN